MKIIEADNSNITQWAELTVKLFPDHSLEETLEYCREFLHNKKELGFLCELDGEYIGFMNLSIRNDYVNGTESSPVLFLEAIYTKEKHRRKGVAKAFIKYAEAYAKNRIITELASDCNIKNFQSEAFHKGCGFIEKERVICFAKKL